MVAKLSKASKAVVNYRTATGPDRRCGTCSMFRDCTCTLVAGQIGPGMVCDRWAAAGSVGERAWNPDLHPRIPGGEHGGEFRHVMDFMPDADYRDTSDHADAGTYILDSIGLRLDSDDIPAHWREARDSYQSEDYIHINGSLRDGDRLDGRFARTVAALDEALRAPEARSTKPFVLYRGLTIDEMGPDPADMVGRVYVDKGFVSTTADREIAEDFADNNAEGLNPGQRAILHILAPAGTPMAVVSDVGRDMFDQAEVLLPRGGRYLLRDMWTDNDDRIHFEVETAAPA